MSLCINVPRLFHVEHFVFLAPTLVRYKGVMSYKYNKKQIQEVATKIKEHGFDVYIAEKGTYGFYTDQSGERVCSFASDIVLSFSGNYKGNIRTGSGWRQDTPDLDSFEDLQSTLDCYAPRWATNGEKVDYTTLEQHLATYQKSSKFKKFEL